MARSISSGNYSSGASPKHINHDHDHDDLPKPSPTQQELLKSEVPYEEAPLSEGPLQTEDPSKTGEPASEQPPPPPPAAAPLPDQDQEQPAEQQPDEPSDQPDKSEGQQEENGGGAEEGKDQVDLETLVAAGGDLKKTLDEQYRATELKQLIQDKGHKVKGTRKA